MIISDILTNPKALETFSYFGDTRDTINFLICKRDVVKEDAAPINQMIATLTERYTYFKANYIQVQPLRSDAELMAKRDAISKMHNSK